MSELALKWIYVLDEDWEWPSGHDFGAGAAFEDSTGRRRLELRPGGGICVLKDYAWDGCTPKFALWDIVIGTPDGVPNSITKKPKAYYASLLHDALYQFLDAGLPLTRAQADRLFLDVLAKHRFAPRWIYYAAVRLLGGLSRQVTKRKRRYKGRKVAL